MIKLAIIGASYLQEPLIEKAKSMGIETHVFAWAAGDVGEKSADYFYPISIVEKEQILEKCKEIGINGICSIASDLAAITVNYVAHAMELVGNSPECALISTNKHLMREAFEKNGDPSPKSILVSSVRDLSGVQLQYPVIVKPIDRSGSRGITKLLSPNGLLEAIEEAKEQGFEKKALVEEFVTGQEYSVECISYHGEHHFLALTKKYTTGAPHFIETGHLEPAPVSEEVVENVKKIVFHALDSLKIVNGASHSEIKIDQDGNIKLIEIGGRMGGDCIGSDLVQLSTGESKELASGAWSLYDRLSNEIKETSATNDASNGASAAGVTSGSAIAALQEAGGKVSRDSNKLAQEAMTELAQLEIELMRQFYNLPRIFRITGENNQTTYEEFDNTDLRKQPLTYTDTDGQTVNYTDEDGNILERLPIFDIDVKAQKASPFATAAQNEMMMNLFQMGAFNPQAADATLVMLDGMTFEGKEKLIEKIKQNQTLSQAVQELSNKVQMLEAMNASRTAADVQNAMPSENAQNAQQTPPQTESRAAM